MPSGGLSRAIDNRSLADDPERTMELSKAAGRRAAEHPVTVWMFP